jgi:hypothetical protein
MKFDSENAWRAAKAVCMISLTRKQAMEKLGIGERKYWQVRKSNSYVEYQKLVNEFTHHRKGMRRMQRSTERELDKITRGAKYDRQEYVPECHREEGGMLATILCVLFVFVVFVIIPATVILGGFLSGR